jgi:hypothetical protein
MFGLPMEAREVTQNELQSYFPTEEVLAKWHAGEEAEWPPTEPPELRFEIGAEVVCRVGPTDWASGRVTQLWYRETQWPEGAFAPYKIRLEDGRDIFAPADMEEIIKLDPNNTLPALQPESAAQPSNQ